jgi:hypothetical protein
LLTGATNHASRPFPVLVWKSDERENLSRTRRCSMPVVDMACLLCRGTARAAGCSTAEIELRCRVCGLYTITVGAVNTLRQNPAKASRVRAEVERRCADGDVIPRVDMDFLDSALTR